MSTKRKLAFIAILTATVLIFISCGMTKPYFAPEPGEEFQMQEANEIIVKCRNLSQSEIKKMHGTRTNPFTPPPMMVTPQKMIIYELEITNNDTAPLKIDIRDINLFYNDKDIRPMSQKDMYDKITAYSDKSNKLREKRVAKKFMFPNVKTIAAGSTVKGYIVFMATIRGQGFDAEFVPAFRTVSNDDAGSVSFKYKYKRLKK